MIKMGARKDNDGPGKIRLQSGNAAPQAGRAAAGIVILDNFSRGFPEKGGRDKSGFY